MQKQNYFRPALSRRTLLAGLIATGASQIVPAPALARGLGKFRRVALVNNRTGEAVRTVYWADGAYIPEALAAIDILMRDWRQDAVHPIARATVDILAETYRLLDCQEPFEVISGYRTPHTNALLRRRGRGAARNSYHIKAMAADIRLASRSVGQISRAALSLKAGGVGRYSRSSFVHVDSGPQRTWGR
ncbi:MAG: DUF882 domain-containing protein [Pseudomonadota bacterium]